MPVDMSTPDTLGTGYADTKTDDTLVDTPIDPVPDGLTKGLTASELNDPNQIKVVIADTSAPLIILFGPPSCGKTMTLVRLTRYLKSLDYVVSPIRSFRPSYDDNYKEICNTFDTLINSDDAARSTDRINFMLVEVIKNGRRICQILEAPGEYYFNPKKPQAPFPTYVNTIINSSNRKVWAMMVEPDWENDSDRRNYASKIAKLKQSMRPKDDVVFVFNKIDLTNFVRGVGNVNLREAIRNTEYLYPAIFTPFKNQNPITSLWRSYNCEFVPFQTGTYTDSQRGLQYQEGPVEYCVKLWKVLLSKITG